MELSSFFFGYSGLGMAIIEYELRHFLINGVYVEGVDPTTVPPPLGIDP